MKKNKIILSIVLMVIMTGSLFANDYILSNDDINPIQTEEEKSSDVRNYKNTAFDKTLFYTNLSPNLLNIGFAKKFNKFYLSMNFDGNLFGEIYTFGKSENSDFFDEISILMGFANMGIKGSLSYNGFGYPSETKPGETSFDNSGLNVKGNLCWGGNFKLSDIYLKPYIDFTYINKNESFNEIHNGTIGSGDNDSSTSIDTFSIKGGTDIGFGEKEKLYSEVGLFYTYNNFSVKPNINVKTESGSSFQILNPEEVIFHQLDADYKFSLKLNERFDLFGKTDLDITFGKGKQYDTDKSDKKIIQNINLFYLDCGFDFGGKYVIKPEILSTTFGLKSNIFNIDSSKTESVEEYSSENTDAHWVFLPEISLYGKLDWNITDNWIAKLNVEIPVSKDIKDSFIKAITIGFTYKN